MDKNAHRKTTFFKGKETILVTGTQHKEVRVEL